MKKLNHYYVHRESGRLYWVKSKQHGYYALYPVNGPGCRLVDYADLEVQFVYYNP